jgi:hypothetical protein
MKHFSLHIADKDGVAVFSLLAFPSVDALSFQMLLSAIHTYIPTSSPFGTGRKSHPLPMTKRADACFS